MTSRQSMLILGGTGSLGKALLRHLVGDYGITVFSRDEAKHVAVKQLYPEVTSIIGDIRDRDSVLNAVMRVEPQIIINAAALKNVPEVEDVPMEGVKTSLIGTENLNNAVRMYGLSSPHPMKILTVSTDKACKPVNSYGMAKALQERLHIRANCGRFICNVVRYGNVLESRGSLIPLIKSRFEEDKEVFITHKDMTRFFLTLDSSVSLIKTALSDSTGGKVFVPLIKSARITDVVDIFRSFYGRDNSKVKFSRARPGEKIDEILISVEEACRTELLGDVFAIHDVFSGKEFHDMKTELSSGSPDSLLSREELAEFLTSAGLLG